MSNYLTSHFEWNQSLQFFEKKIAKWFSLRCRIGHVFFFQLASVIKDDSKATESSVPFPLGLARNVAKDAAPTHFVMVSQPGRMPSPRIPERFDGIYCIFDACEYLPWGIFLSKG